jgi:hypothetical protein
MTACLIDARRVGMMPTTTSSRDLPATISATPTGLDLDADLSFAEWQSIARNFGQALQSAAWCIGDWLVYGENKWGRQMALKGEGFDDISSSRIPLEAYELALDATGLDLGTLKNYAMTCRAIPRDARRPGLTFAHHLALVPLKPDLRLQWLEVIDSAPRKPTVKRLRLSLRIADPDEPRIVADQEIMRRGQAVGHDNYVPHLTRLLTVLRKTLPDMSEFQREALREDCEQLLEMIGDL